MLFISIGLHAVLLAVAARWIVQSIVSGRNLNFKSTQPSGATAASGGTNREYRVRPALSAPSTPVAAPLPSGLASPSKPSLSLPSTALPITSTSPLSRLSGDIRGAAAPAAALWKSSAPKATPSAFKPASSMGGFSGSAANFGVKPSQGAGTGMVGTLYYMRRDKEGKEIPAYPPDEYLSRMVQLLSDNGKIKETESSKYFRVPQQLASFVMLFPPISGEIAPAAFGAQQVPDHRQCWFVVYQGKISAPTNNRYRFLGGGNEVLIVRVDGRVVLDGSWGFPWPQRGQSPTGRGPRERLPAIYGDKRAVGDWFKFAPAGSEVEVIIGAGWRGAFGADLCVEEEGQTYQDNIRPIFKLEGYQKMQAQIDSALQLPEAASSFKLEGPTFRAR